MNLNPYEKQKLRKFDPASSLEAMFVGKLIRDVALVGRLPRDNDEVIKEIILKKFNNKHPKFSGSIIPDIIKELKAYEELGYLFEPVAEKVKVQKKEPEREFIGTNVSEINLVIVDDPEKAKAARAEIDREEINQQKKFIFENKQVINNLLEKSHNVLNAGKPEDYIQANLLSQEEVRKDNEEIREIEATFDLKNTPEGKEAKKLATIFEAIVIEGVNLSKCLGDNVVARPAFPHDDIFEPKIDSYFILENTPLGVDVSMRNINGEAFAEKIKKNLRAINRDEKKLIKYYKNADGMLETGVFAPKVIISCDISMIKSLMADFNILDQDKFSEKLKNHPVSREIVSQVVGECIIFGEYAREKNRQMDAEYYENILSIINKISEESIALKRLMVNAGKDAVCMKIREIVSKFKESEERDARELQEFREAKQKSEAA